MLQMWSIWAHEEELSAGKYTGTNTKATKSNLCTVRKRKTCGERMLLPDRRGWESSTVSGKRKEERARSPARHDTSDGDGPGTNRAVIGERRADALSKVLSRLPSDPDLLPPGAQCTLATSKLICFLDESHAEIPTGICGDSHRRQDFLIVGLDRSSILGLIVYPSVVSADKNTELTVLAKALRPPLTVAENTQVARAFALPPHAIEQVMSIFDEEGFPLKEHVEIHASWVKHIGRDRPTLTCQLTCGDRTIEVRGMLDTGADVTVISYIFWPRDWSLIAPLGTLSGIGGASLCLQSENSIVVTGPGNKTAIIRPFVVQKPITVWGRDLLAQWGMRIEVDF